MNNFLSYSRLLVTILIGIFLGLQNGFVYAAHSGHQKQNKITTVKKTEVIHVKNGGTIHVTAGFVREKIGKHWVNRLAYNGMIPGPTVKVEKGSEIKFILKNMTAEPTSLHSHGLRVDDKNDGVIGIGQDPIPVGGTFTYTLKFPDQGLYWYHPHMHDEYGQEMGLQGNFLVVDSQSAFLPDVDAEEILMMDDLLLENGKMPGFSGHTPSYALMGRFGNRFLINNRDQWSSKAAVGDVVRYWITNTANARPLKLTFSGARMKVVGSDNGPYERDFIADSIVLAPSERVVVDVLFENEGVVTIENIGPEKKVTFGKILVSRNSNLKTESIGAKKEKFLALKSRPELTSEFMSMRKLKGKEPDFTMKIDATLRGQHADHMMEGEASKDGIEWDDTMPEMNAEMTGKEVSWRVIDPATGKENMDINWIFKKNQPVKIRILNDGKHHPMQHPMHFHGQRFVVLSRNGVMEENLSWKDTVLVPAGQFVDVVLDNQNPGRWMGHCHISEHLATGMMFGFEVR